MKFVTLSSCTGWEFVHEGPGTSGEVVHPIAAWGITGEGDVVGLMAVSGGGADRNMPGTCRLVSVPPVKGTYRQVI